MSEKKIYEKNWFIILSLLVFFPVGLYLMWKHSKWGKEVKAVVSVLCVTVILVILAPNPDVTAPELSTKSSISYNLDASISDETIIKDAVIEATDDRTSEEKLNIYIDDYKEITSDKIAKKTVSLCASDKALNVTCNDVIVSIEDKTKPVLSTKEKVVFQLGDNITDEIIIDKALESVTDNVSKAYNIKVSVKEHGQISNKETSENTLSVCAEDKASNTTCNNVIIQVSDSEAKKAAAEKKAAEEKAAAEKKAAEEKAAADQAAAEEKAAEAQAAAQQSTYTPEASVDASAGHTAKCNDGTYSDSQHHSGTCSHHGGVAVWYK